MKLNRVSTGAATLQPAKLLLMDDYVPYQFAMISSRLSRALEAVYASQYGLSRTEWRALALASEVAGCSASDLVERSGMDPVAIHRAVKRLEGLGLVSRQSVKHDKRLRPLHVTRKGRNVYEAVAPHALALEVQLLDRLDAAEARVLKSALSKLMAVAFDIRSG